MNEIKFYQIKELSKLADVSVRTLHHYDDIGLLKAKRNHLNGYRYYTLDDAVRLQQIVFYRKLDLSLEEIKRITTASCSLIEMLKGQHALLLQRQKETQSIIENLEMAMSTLRGEQNLDVLFGSIPKDKAEQWKKELVNTQGGTSILQAFAGFSESDMRTKEAISDDWCKRYVAVLANPIEDESVQQLVGEAYLISNQAISEINPELADKFLDCEGYRSFTELSKANSVFEDMYEHYAKGFAEHLYRATIYFCDNQLKTNAQFWLAQIH
ncbi:MerR family transcriptional regulator [Rheinheimera sp.]|uniref:MerR family transcriptional regulator n=1 Tax=Rheinheimera sp. TaxID=1869214 RepID=UPI0027B98FDC|nr:MerR family transcriptional regulator [Rheinheimera sp.]